MSEWKKVKLKHVVKDHRFQSMEKFREWRGRTIRIALDGTKKIDWRICRARVLWRVHPQDVKRVWGWNIGPRFVCSHMVEPIKNGKRP